MSRFQVAFVGNHIPPYATERELDLAFASLGWNVVELQENTVTTERILQAALESDFALFTHTHGWHTSGRYAMEDVIQILRDNRKPTVSYHLDRFVGIPDREPMVGQFWFFKTDYVITADGGNQEFFESRGVRHIWMPPAIGDRHCYIAQPNPIYACDVCFVGSKCYHDTVYPFRRKMVEWLDSEHGFTVKRWGGDRPGARVELNEIYASAKICVGDSIFAGAPYYWSDRVTEVQGRGGFLVHPASEGMNVTGMAHYRPQDLDDLDQVIQYYLAHDEERDRMRIEGFEWTKQHHTCSRRIIEILNKVTELSGVKLN